MMINELKICLNINNKGQLNAEQHKVPYKSVLFLFFLFFSRSDARMIFNQHEELLNTATNSCKLTRQKRRYLILPTMHCFQ